MGTPQRPADDVSFEVTVSDPIDELLSFSDDEIRDIMALADIKQLTPHIDNDVAIKVISAVVEKGFRFHMDTPNPETGRVEFYISHTDIKSVLPPLKVDIYADLYTTRYVAPFEYALMGYMRLLHDMIRHQRGERD